MAAGPIAERNQGKCFLQLIALQLCEQVFIATLCVTAII